MIGDAGFLSIVDEPKANHHKANDCQIIFKN